MHKSTPVTSANPAFYQPFISLLLIHQTHWNENQLVVLETGSVKLTIYGNAQTS
jgi:hypothetical protein